MTITRSASTISFMSWVTWTMVIPLSFRDLITPSTLFLPRGSRKEVGSSITMYDGFMARTPAMATSCFSPPERVWGALSAQAVMPTRSSECSTRFRISREGRPRFPGPNETSSWTVIPTIWLSGFWKTMPTLCRMSRRASDFPVFRPSTSTSPFVGTRRPLRCLIRVVFPQPFGPMTAIYKPSCISRSIS